MYFFATLSLIFYSNNLGQAHKRSVEVFEVSDLTMRMVTILCGWFHFFLGDGFSLGGVASLHEYGYKNVQNFYFRLIGS